MAFDFDALKPEAKRAAFAHMRLGSGARHKKLSAKKKAAVEHQGRGRVSGKLGSGSVKGQLSAADSDKGSMGGNLPIAKARPSTPKPAAAKPTAPEEPAANPVDARFNKAITKAVQEITSRPGNSGDYAGLADLREIFDARGISREAQDKHLKRMSREGKLYIVPEDNRKALKQADHDAALRIGGEDNHVVSLITKPQGGSSSEPMRVRTITGTPEELSKRPLSAHHAKGEPTENDHMILANRYLLMHGDAGVQKKISQLENRKRLGPGDRATLAALRALKRK